MTLASTWMDLVVGMDVHMHLLPSPAGPVPTPIPQPFVGMVGDPVNQAINTVAGALVSLAYGERPELSTGLVLVNDLPATTTDGACRNSTILPHVPTPPAVGYVAPPRGRASFPLGALKISFGGASAIRMGDLALSCSDPVAMPTSRVVVIPKGPPVMIEGVPGLDPARAIAGWAMGKIVRTAFRQAGAALRYTARLSGPRLRNLISRARCFVTGHPIDVATGRVFTEAVDFSLPGPLPLVFERTYFSSWSHRDGTLGRGWSHSLDLALWFEHDLAIFRNPEGQEIVFLLPDGRRRLEIDEEVFEPISGSTLCRKRDGWSVITAAGIIHRFARVGSAGSAGSEEGPAILRVVRTTSRNPALGIDYAYDDRGRLARVTDCGGRAIRLEHDERGRLRRLLGPDPSRSEQWVVVAELDYSPDGLLTEVRDALGNATRYAYDGGLLVQETDRNGVAFFWIYDGRGSGARCVRTWGHGARGGEVIYNQKIDYDPDGRTTLVSDSYDAKTLYKTNALGAVTEVVDALGGKTLYQYDDALRLIAATDPVGNRTAYHHGARGQLLSTVLPDGARVLQKFDPRCPELVILRVDEVGAAWRFRYDPFGQLVEERGPEPDAWRRYEWEDGLIAAVIEASGARTEVLERDRCHAPVRIRLPGGGEVRRELDGRGRCVATIDPYGARRTIRYDAADRVIGVSEPDGNVRTIARDGVGNVVEVVDRQGAIRFTYAGFNALASQEAGGDTIRFERGQEGELLEVRDQDDQAHRFAYDPCLRLEREVGFDRQETRYERNAAGWATSVDRAGGHAATTYAHDARGRVVSVQHSDGTWARLAYRKDGALIEAANQTTTVRFDRDALGRVTREMQGDVEVRSFHASGFRTRMESSLGASLTVARDGLGNPTSVAVAQAERTAAFAFEYDACGLEARRALPGGLTITSPRDPAGRPTRQNVVAPGGGFAREYGWTFDDRLARIADTRFGLVEYQHDARGRLVGERRGETRLARRLDGVGNVYRSADGTDRHYRTGGVLAGAGETTFAFDPLGNLAEKTEPGARVWTYAWDGAGMLTSVTGPDDLRVTYAYDALGRRVGKSAGAVETRWLWDGDVVLHELRSDRPMTTWYHEPESFAPLAQVSAREIHAFVTDQIGTPTALYDGTGALTWQMQLDLFGVPRSKPEATVDCPIRWPGQYHDPETGLHYNRFRYYDPGLGQYISQDPLGLLGGIAAYAYTDDPAVLIDPWGLMELDPWVIRFSQRSVSENVKDYQDKMQKNEWQWSASNTPRVMNVEGHWVTYDNRRVMAAQNAHLPTIPVEPVDPRAASLKKGLTWWRAFRAKRTSRQNRLNGEPVPPTGLVEQPRITCR